MTLPFEILKEHGKSRLGILKTAHGDIRTPAFMPVGTRGTVKGMFPESVAETGADIDIKDDGTVFIASPDQASIEATKKWIEQLTKEPEVGTIYDGTVVKIMDFGAFVNIMPGIDGMVHVSEIAEQRIGHPSEVLKEGEKVTVKLVAIDEKGRLSLSIKKAK